MPRASIAGAMIGPDMDPWARFGVGDDPIITASSTQATWNPPLAA